MMAMTNKFRLPEKQLQLFITPLYLEGQLLKKKKLFSRISMICIFLLSIMSLCFVMTVCFKILLLSPDPQSTHPDIVRMKPSWVLRHVLGQVCVLHKMGKERVMSVELEQCPKVDHRSIVRGITNFRIFQTTVQKIHNQVSQGLTVKVKHSVSF